MNINYENNIYIIDRNFRLVEFDKAAGVTAICSKPLFILEPALLKPID